MPFEYLLILGIIFLISIFLKFKFKVKVFNNFKQMLIFYVLIIIFGSFWDNFAVFRGHWFYPGKGILGIFIGLIPIEDYVFIVVLSYFVLVFYKTLQKLIK